MDQANLPGDSIGYINFAPFLIGTAVIDAYQFKLAVAGIHYADELPSLIRAVARNEVEKAARKYLTSGSCVLVVAGPVIDKEILA